MLKNNLREILDQEGFIQADLSKATGLSPTTINKVVNQKKEIKKLSSMHKIVNGLNKIIFEAGGPEKKYKLNDIFEKETVKKSTEKDDGKNNNFSLPSVISGAIAYYVIQQIIKVLKNENNSPDHSNISLASLKGLIGDNKLESLFGILDKYLLQKGVKDDEYLLLKSRYFSLKNRDTFKTMKDEEFFIEENKIKIALLEKLEELISKLKLKKLLE